MINIKSHIRNVRNSVLLAKNYLHAIRYFMLIYERLFIYFFKKNRSINIKFNLPEPIGDIHLLQRFNSGADIYIFSEVFIENGYNITLESVPMNILDLGANVGYASIYFKKKYPLSHVVCIEPMKSNLKFLYENVSLNELNIDILEGAVSCKTGFIYMDSGLKDYDFKVSNKQNEHSIRVKAFTIDEIMMKYGWNQIDLLKIDIEGYEKELFFSNTDWIFRVNNILIEVHFPMFGETEIKDIVAKYDFASYQIVNGLYFLTRNKSV